MKGLSKNGQNHDFKEAHYSMRQKIGDAESISTRNINPPHSVKPKRPESQYGAKYVCFAENPVFPFFGPRGLVIPVS